MPTSTKVKSDRKHLVEDEVSALIRAASKGRWGTRDRAMVALLFYYGMRASELVGLKVSDLDLGSGHIYVRRCKGSNSSTQRLNSESMRAVRRYLAERPVGGFQELFLSERGEPFTRFGLNYLVKTWGERARLPFRVHPHMLRHSCGYALVNRDGGSKDLRLVQDYLGHKDPRHTAQYTMLAPQRFEGLWD